jgi:hypothetical protein
MIFIKLTEFEYGVTREIWINAAQVRYFYQSVSEHENPPKGEIVTKISMGTCGTGTTPLVDSVSVLESPLEVLSRIKAREGALV